MNLLTIPQFSILFSERFISYKIIQLTAGWGGGYDKAMKIKIIFPFSKYCEYQNYKHIFAKHN